MDIETVYRIIFVVGIVAIPLLYWLSGRESGHNKGTARNEEGQARRGTQPQQEPANQKRRSHGPSE